jgi:hypothetical protein
MQLICALFAVGWLVGLVVLYIYWSSMPTWSAALAIAGLVVFTPSLADVFQTYNAHLNREPAERADDPQQEHVMSGQMVRLIDPPRQSGTELRAKVAFGAERWVAILENPDESVGLRAGDAAIVTRGKGNVIYIRSLR